MSASVDFGGHGGGDACSGFIHLTLGSSPKELSLDLLPRTSLEECPTRRVRVPPNFESCGPIDVPLENVGDLNAT